jgi:hypothetical protein
MEWTKAERFDQVRSCWGRLGGRTTLHRYGRRHFSELAHWRRSAVKGGQPHDYRARAGVYFGVSRPCLYPIA